MQIVITWENVVFEGDTNKIRSLIWISYVTRAVIIMSLSHVCKGSVNHALKVAYGYVSILSKADIEIEVIAQQSSMELSNMGSKMNEYG